MVGMVDCFGEGDRDLGDNLTPCPHAFYYHNTSLPLPPSMPPPAFYAYPATLICLYLPTTSSLCLYLPDPSPPCLLLPHLLALRAAVLVLAVPGSSSSVAALHACSMALSARAHMLFAGRAACALPAHPIIMARCMCCMFVYAAWRGSANSIPGSSCRHT